MGWPEATVAVIAIICVAGILSRAIDKRSPAPTATQGLPEILRDAGDKWGPLGVAKAAAELTDRDVLIAELTDPKGDDWSPTPSSPS